MTKLKKTAIWSIILAVILKLSGLVRESILAKEFGASADTTGYYLAFSFITLVIAMIATGFNNVFLPMYIERKNSGKDMSDRNANGLLNTVVIFFIFISIVGWYGSSWFVPLIFFNMSEAVAQIAISMTKLFFIFMTLIVLSTLLDSYLQSRRILVPSQLAKLLAAFFSALFAYIFSDVWGIYSVAYGFITGTIIGLLIQVYFLTKSDYIWKPELKMESNFRKLFVVLLIPSLLNSVVGQVNLFVNKSFASGTSDAAVTYLNNATMIISIPNAIYATTLVTIIFTVMSEQVSDEQAFKNTFFKGMELSLAILLPISIGLLIVGEEIISFIFEGGKYTTADSHQTYLALLLYTPTIVFQGMQLILSKSLYAKGETSTVFRISITTILLNLLLNWILVNKYGYLALPFSTSVVSAYYFLVSMFIVYKDFGLFELRRFVNMFWKIGIATVIMGLFVGSAKVIIPFNESFPVLQLIVLIPIGVVIYIICLRLFHPSGFIRLIALLERKK